jgi:hypothetical protein
LKITNVKKVMLHNHEESYNQIISLSKKYLKKLSESILSTA